MSVRTVPGQPVPVFHFQGCILYGTDQVDGCPIELRRGNSEVLGEFARLGRWLEERRAARGDVRPTPWALGLDALRLADASASPPARELSPWDSTPPPAEEDRQPDAGYLW